MEGYAASAAQRARGPYSYDSYDDDGGGDPVGALIFIVILVMIFGLTSLFSKKTPAKPYLPAKKDSPPSAERGNYLPVKKDDYPSERKELPSAQSMPCSNTEIYSRVQPNTSGEGIISKIIIRIAAPVFFWFFIGTLWFMTGCMYLSEKIRKTTKIIGGPLIKVIVTFIAGMIFLGFPMSEGSMEGEAAYIMIGCFLFSFLLIWGYSIIKIFKNRYNRVKRRYFF
jgi:hypothetical protein